MNGSFLGCRGEVITGGLEWYVGLGEGVVIPGGLVKVVEKLWLRVLPASVVRGMRCPSSCMVIGIVDVLITAFG